MEQIDRVDLHYRAIIECRKEACKASSNECSTVFSIYLCFNSFSGFDKGPLNILKRSVQEKLKVKVFTRNVRGMRGVCVGYVVAFDKHMNLVS